MDSLESKQYVLDTKKRIISASSNRNLYKVKRIGLIIWFELSFITYISFSSWKDATLLYLLSTVYIVKMANWLKIIHRIHLEQNKKNNYYLFEWKAIHSFMYAYVLQM